jgi:NAD-dependent protein deacetylase/lipoamidase
MPSDEDTLNEVRSRLAGETSVCVLTGAGISADSGVPTFRGPDGLWRNFRAEDLATPEAFSKNPRLVWEWYDWRRGIISEKSPNAAHAALVTLEDRLAEFTLITQNVDGLHSLAGSRRLIEMHGNIWKVRCTRCGEIKTNREVPLKLLPHCTDCGNLLRPHIVWFGEAIDPADIEACLGALQRCTLLLVIGTSGVVQPAASFADIARSAGAFTVEINPDPTGRTGAFDAVLRGRSAEVVPKLL